LVVGGEETNLQGFGQLVGQSFKFVLHKAAKVVFEGVQIALVQIENVAFPAEAVEL
jgi:hypothetical protein